MNKKGNIDYMVIFVVTFLITIAIVGIMYNIVKENKDLGSESSFKVDTNYKYFTEYSKSLNSSDFSISFFSIQKIPVKLDIYCFVKDSNGFEKYCKTNKYSDQIFNEYTLNNYTFEIDNSTYNSMENIIIKIMLPYNDNDIIYEKSFNTNTVGKSVINLKNLPTDISFDSDFETRTQLSDDDFLIVDKNSEIYAKSGICYYKLNTIDTNSLFDYNTECVDNQQNYKLNFTLLSSDYNSKRCDIFINNQVIGNTLLSRSSPTSQIDFKYSSNYIKNFKIICNNKITYEINNKIPISQITSNPIYILSPVIISTFDDIPKPSVCSNDYNEEYETFNGIYENIIMSYIPNLSTNEIICKDKYNSGYGNRNNLNVYNSLKTNIDKEILINMN